MAEENVINLSPELLNDFFAEAEEHLTAIRHAILSLEEGLESSDPAATVDKLFRSYHSLKGILGMAGIRSGEQLAHRTEDFLRLVSKGGVEVTLKSLDVLAVATDSIDQTVAAFRDKKPLPDVAASLSAIDALLKSSAVTEKREEAPADDESLNLKLGKAFEKGNSVWKFTFFPSPALSERGVNVNVIRQRLEKTGEIIHAAPKIEGGAITFEFYLTGKTLPAEVSSWEGDGVEFQEIQKRSEPSARQEVSASTTNLLSASAHLIRVDLGRLDDLMRISGELVIQQARLEKQMDDLASLHGTDVRGLQEVNLRLSRQFRELRETVMRLRLVPLSEIFDRIPFVVRDLTRESEKKVRLVIQGQRTELDKYVVERLREPLLHLVRNAVSHAIEDAEERLAHGKPAEGTLTLSATTSGERVIITVADDGRGLDREKIAVRARELGFDQKQTMSNAAVLELVCLPGFSTREEADLASGRGVGMAVVHNTVRELGGTLSLDSKTGQGTTFTMGLPLTLLITDALIVSSANQQFAIPQGNVEEVLHIEEATVNRMDKTELVSVRGQALPLVRLREVFGYPTSDKSMPTVVVSQTERGRVGLVVDRVNGQRQIVVRSLRDPLVNVAGVVGATELGDGRPLLILDPTALTRSSEMTRTGIVSAGQSPWAQLK